MLFKKNDIAYDKVKKEFKIKVDKSIADFVGLLTKDQKNVKVIRSVIYWKVDDETTANEFLEFAKVAKIIK